MPDTEQTFLFIDPAGVEFPLTTDTADGTDVAFGVQGRFMPKVESVIERIPGQHGGRRRQTTFGVREVVVPLEMFGVDGSDLRVRVRALVRAFDPTRGDSVLRCVAPDGVIRQIGCRYDSGMELVESLDLLGNLQRAAVVFSATDPLWYDLAPMSSTFTVGAAANFLGDPFLPLKLSSDKVLGTQSVSNGGDVEAWPVWTVNGPASSILLENVTTGERIDLPVVLLAGQSLIVDTRPFRKTVRRDDGTNLFGSLTAASSLWALDQGGTTIRTTVPGSTSATFVTLVFSQRWLTP